MNIFRTRSVDPRIPTVVFDEFYSGARKRTLRDMDCFCNQASCFYDYFELIIKIYTRICIDKKITATSIALLYF